MSSVSDRQAIDSTILRIILGPLEARVMQVLWQSGEYCVRDVVDRIEQRKAYTTVMTTLDRLYRKKLIDRKKFGRTYFYWARVSCRQWQQRMARHVVARLLSGSETSRELLVACLLEAMGEHDPKLLQDLQDMIANRFGRHEAQTSSVGVRPPTPWDTSTPDYAENFIPGIS